MEDSSIKACVRVISFDKETDSLLGEIGKIGKDSIELFNAKDEDVTEFTQDLKMVLLLATESTDDLQCIASKFFKADVPTFGVFTTNSDDFDSFTDAYTIVPPSEMTTTVKDLIYPAFNSGMINLDLDDIINTLYGKKHFHVVSARAKGEDRVALAIDAIAATLPDKLRDGIENLTLVLYYNPAAKPVFNVKEIEPIQQLISTLPRETDTVWAVYHEPTLTDGSILISAIAAGSRVEI